MIFTIFTVMLVSGLYKYYTNQTLLTAYSFLPLSFFTSLFGINVREWSGESTNLTMSEMLSIAGMASKPI